MVSHKIDYKIYGDDIQFVEIELDPQETVIAEAGTIIPIDLKQINNSLIVQKDGFLCAALGTKLSVTLNKKIGSGLLGGEGLFLATIRGTGKVWLQSMPIRKLIRALSPYGKNTKKEAGSILGNLLER